MQSNIDRMSAIILARSVYDRRELLQMRGEIEVYVGRLANFGLFSTGEISLFSGLSEYQVRKTVAPDILLHVKSGLRPEHLEHALRMVGDANFSKIHAKFLIDSGATPSALARVTGQSERSLRRWSEGESK